MLREYVGEPRRTEWKTAHGLLVKALNPSPQDKSYKQFQKLLARHRQGQDTPLTEEEIERWFSFNSFLELLGLASINQEDSGGLYALHAHINHSCEPNVSVRFNLSGHRTGHWNTSTADSRRETCPSLSPLPRPLPSLAHHLHPTALASEAQTNSP